jgi:hypothetical protein
MKLKFVPILLARIKNHKIFKENFSKPVEKISNFLCLLLLKSIKGAFYKVFALGGKTNDQTIVLKNTKTLKQIKK